MPKKRHSRKTTKLPDGKVNLPVYMDVELRNMIEKRAKRDGRSMTNWIKQLILREFEDATRSTEDDQEDYGSDFDKSPAVKPQPPLPFTPGAPRSPETGSG